MSFYEYGLLFTMGWLLVFDEKSEDSWKKAFVFLFFSLLFPFYWGVQIADIIKKNMEAGVKKGEAR
jgi:hypothetical protein